MNLGSYVYIYILPFCLYKYPLLIYFKNMFDSFPLVSNNSSSGLLMLKLHYVNVKLHISYMQSWEVAMRNRKMASSLICLPFSRLILILLSYVDFIAPSISVPEVSQRFHLNSVVVFVLRLLFLIIFSICLPFV